MEYFNYTQQMLDELVSKDKVLKKAVDEIGYIKREVISDPLKSIINQIISQQISKGAAITIYQRLSDLSKEFDINILSKLTLEEIKQCGLSYRKAQYLFDIISKVNSNELDLYSLRYKSNQEVIEQLTKLNGIGIWSAEMFLLFSLQRLDIISYGDFAIRKGIKKLYQLESLSKAEFKVYEKRYGKYASIASLYLWHIAHLD